MRASPLCASHGAQASQFTAFGASQSQFPENVKAPRRAAPQDWWFPTILLKRNVHFSTGNWSIENYRKSVFLGGSLRAHPTVVKPHNLQRLVRCKAFEHRNLRHFVHPGMLEPRNLRHVVHPKALELRNLRHLVHLGVLELRILRHLAHPRAFKLRNLRHLVHPGPFKPCNLWLLAHPRELCHHNLRHPGVVKQRTLQHWQGQGESSRGSSKAFPTVAQGRCPSGATVVERPRCLGCSLGDPPELSEGSPSRGSRPSP